jgi:hypothetical protein
MDSKPLKKPRSDAQRKAWARYLLRLCKRHNDRLKADWIRQLYEDHILPSKK